MHDDIVITRVSPVFKSEFSGYDLYRVSRSHIIGY